jgi:hypothetical protein
MAESTEKLRAELREIEQRRRKILRHLMSKEELAVGSVSWVDRTCGRPNCHCAEGGGHRTLQFLWKDESGRRRCQLVRKADHQRLLRASARYADYRESMKELKAIEDEERTILVALKRARQISYE